MAHVTLDGAADQGDCRGWLRQQGTAHRRSRSPRARGLCSAQGVTRTGEPLSSGTVTYTASLAKQMTAACVALLVQEGVLDIEAPLAKWLPELPAWAARVQLRHLLCHTAALPDQQVEAILGTADRTTAAVLSALTQVPVLASPPGVVYAYSGAGYICLAVALERAAGEPLPAFAERGYLLLWP